MRDKKNNIFSEDIPSINTDIIDVNSSEKVIKNPRPAAASGGKKQKPMAEMPSGNIRKMQRNNMICWILVIIAVAGGALSSHLVVKRQSAQLKAQMQDIDNNLKVYAAKINTHNQDAALQQLQKNMKENSELLFQINAETNRNKLEEQEKLLKLSKINQALKSENQILRGSIQNQQEKSSSLNRLRASYDKQLKSLQEQLTIIKKDKQDMLNSSNSLTVKMKALEAQYKSLNNDKVNLSKLNDRLQADVVRIKHNYDKLKKVSDNHLSSLIKSQEANKQFKALLKKNRIRHSIKINTKRVPQVAPKPKIFRPKTNKKSVPAILKAPPVEKPKQVKQLPVKKKTKTPAKPKEEDKNGNLFWVW